MWYGGYSTRCRSRDLHFFSAYRLFCQVTSDWLVLIITTKPKINPHRKQGALFNNSLMSLAVRFWPGCKIWFIIVVWVRLSETLILVGLKLQHLESDSGNVLLWWVYVTYIILLSSPCPNLQGETANMPVISSRLYDGLFELGIVSVGVD